MDRNRLIQIGAVIVIAAILLGGWALGIQPQLSAAASADRSREQVEAQNKQNRLKLAKLAKDYENIDAVKAERDALRGAIPRGSAMPAFVDEIDAIARKYAVTVQSITVGTAVAYTPPKGAPAAVATPSGGATATPAPTADIPARDGAAPVSDPRISEDNFSAIPISIAVTGSYGDVLDFVHGMQTGTRLFLVTNFSSNAAGVAPSNGGDRATADDEANASLSGLIYVLTDENATSGPPAE